MTAKTDINRQAAVVATRDDAEKIAARVAKNARARAALQAEYEDRVLAVNKDYGARLQKLTDKIDADVDALSGWAASHPDEFAGAKTLVLSGVEIAYRDGVPSVQILEKWDEKKVIAGLSAAGKSRWIRVKQSIEKRVILADYKSGETDERELKKFGLAIVAKPSVCVNVQNAITAAK